MADQPPKVITIPVPSPVSSPAPIPLEAAVNIPDQSVSEKAVPPESLSLLKEIGDRYVALLQSTGDSGKWRQLEQDMMRNIHLLVPIVIPLKDFISMVADCDERAKGSSKHIGKTAGEELRDFLNTNIAAGKPLDTEPVFSIQDAEEPSPAQQAGLVTEPTNADNQNTLQDQSSL